MLLKIFISKMILRSYVSIYTYILKFNIILQSSKFHSFLSCLFNCQLFGVSNYFVYPTHRPPFLSSLHILGAWRLAGFLITHYPCILIPTWIGASFKPIPFPTLLKRFYLQNSAAKSLNSEPLLPIFPQTSWSNWKLILS